ncbi:MAG: hypothetical protein Q4D02_01140 [Clostridia bacterium]|nr:hypothetical protein [Clostridia bacterium]
MPKDGKKIVGFDQIVTTESNVRFLIFENTISENRAKFSEVFYDSGRIISKIRDLEYQEITRLNGNLSMGTCGDRIYFAHDFKIDRGCYFGYIVDDPEKCSKITCQTVIYDHSSFKLQNRTISDIENVEFFDEDTYIITTDSRIYVVKYLRVKNVALAIADYGVIPDIGKKCSISQLELNGNKPLEISKLTSKFIQVKEKEDVYICDTEKTRYIILKERKNDVFGICCYEPRIEQKMQCHGMEFMGIKPYLANLVTGIVTNVKRLGNVYEIKTNSKTYYMEARFRFV